MDIDPFEHDPLFADCDFEFKNVLVLPNSHPLCRCTSDRRERVQGHSAELNQCPPARGVSWAMVKIGAEDKLLQECHDAVTRLALLPTKTLCVEGILGMACYHYFELKCLLH